MRKNFIPVVIALLVGAAAIADAGLQHSPQRVAGRGRVQAQLREFTLTAGPVKWEIQPGLVVDGWGYNGQIPGPTLRVTEGDTVRVHLVNNLPVPTTIHWHGIDVPSNMDGVPGLSQDPVQPGDTFTYEFTATNPGTRWYHSHADPDAQVQLGLYGAFIIDPATPEPVQYDREFTYILGEKALDFTPDVAMGNTDIQHRDAGNGRGGALQYDLFMLNGRAGDAIDPMSIAPGQKIRIRLINAGNLIHEMHLHGQSFKIIATDGNPVPPAAQLTKDTVNIGPGERYDLEVDGTNPGVWMFHCHINNHAANGMTTVLAYDGYEPFSSDVNHLAHGGEAPLPGVVRAPQGPVGSAATPKPTPAPSSTAPSGAAPSGTSSPVSSNVASSASPASGTTILQIDNHFMPSKLTVAAGTTVTWMNNGTNFHTSTSFDGLWDSGVKGHGETFSFTFNQPGTYKFYCRQHILQGMSGTITVTPP